MRLKGLLLVIAGILLGLVSYVLLHESYFGYLVLILAIAVVLVIMGINLIHVGSSPEKMYEANVKDILVTFDSILIQNNEVPKIDGRNVIIVESIDDLVDAQLEIRKPICYFKQTESCAFVLLDDKEAYVYVEKLNDDVVSPLEIAIKDEKIKNKSVNDVDSEMLRDIDKTTIVRLSNRKSYKISPIRKKAKELEKQRLDEINKETSENEMEKQTSVEIKNEEKQVPVEVAPIVNEKPENELEKQVPVEINNEVDNQVTGTIINEAKENEVVINDEANISDNDNENKDVLPEGLEIL